MTSVTEAYSARAAEYTELFGSMAAVHPADRQPIDTWAGTLSGRVLDAGCGPCHWTSHLAGLGLAAHGIDLVPAFIEYARESRPGVAFDIGSIDAIDVPDRALGGVLSWYSTIHHDPARIAIPLAEFARVLRPGGGLVLGFFTGATMERFDHAVAPAFRWPAAELQNRLEACGFEVIETRRRTEPGARPLGAMVCRHQPGSA